MIAFLLADLRDWRKRRMRKTILLSAILLAAVGLFGTLQPLFLATGPSLTGDCEEDVSGTILHRTLPGA